MSASLLRQIAAGLLAAASVSAGVALVCGPSAHAEDPRSDACARLCRADCAHLDTAEQPLCLRPCVEDCERTDRPVPPSPLDDDADAWRKQQQKEEFDKCRAACVDESHCAETGRRWGLRAQALCEENCEHACITKGRPDARPRAPGGAPSARITTDRLTPDATAAVPASDDNDPSCEREARCRHYRDCKEACERRMQCWAEHAEHKREQCEDVCSKACLHEAYGN